MENRPVRGRSGVPAAGVIFPGSFDGPAADYRKRPARPASTRSGHVAGSAAEQHPDQSATIAELRIDEAIDKIAKLDSIAARLVETVEMLNQRFTINGRYLKAPDWRVYLQLTVVGADDTKFTTLQICDGETLWDFQRVLDTRVFTRLAIKPILERLASPDLDQKTKELTITQMGLAGSESLLKGLRKFTGSARWRRTSSWRTAERCGPCTAPGRALHPYSGPTHAPWDLVEWCRLLFPVRPHFTWVKPITGLTSSSLRANNPRCRWILVAGA